jgi:hypothetical protein
MRRGQFVHKGPGSCTNTAPYGPQSPTSRHLETVPPLQRIRTALRTGGRFVYEGQGVKGRDRAVEGTADFGRDEVEPDGAEEVPERLRRAGGSLLEHLLDVAQPILDPLYGSRAEDLLSAAAKSVHVLCELIDSALGLDEGLGERLAATAFADEVDEVREPALLSGELGLLQLQRVREAGAELGDLLSDALEDVSDVLRV